MFIRYLRVAARIGLEMFYAAQTFHVDDAPAQASAARGSVVELPALWRAHRGESTGDELSLWQMLNAHEA